MRITVLHTPDSKFGPYTVVYGLEAWPLGTRRNRGWEKAAVIYQRPATPDEIQEQRESSRFLCFRNRSWEELVADEAKYGVDANALAARWWARRGGLAPSHDHGCVA